ncbi:hypothetical protein GGS26DRAFT_539094 [Hypomontagnella submonticulosa]|nr:hypothetical protein GGS26DRAFT_539094 [Hypomontagnella submonticulosa]
MITIRWALGAIIAASAVSASTDELQFFARLLKRQDPGSPSYNCHDNCGQAIIQGRNSADVCHDDVFLTDYKNCLQCAGPDNQDIWQYYGTTLTKDATPCGLSTTPLSGKQPDVGPAVPAGGSGSGSGSSSSAPPSSSSPSASATSTSGTEPTNGPEPPTDTGSSSSSSSSPEGPSATSGTGESTTTASSGTSASVSPGSVSGYPTATATDSPSVTGASSAVSTPYVPTGTGVANGTATTSSGFVVVTGGANAISGSNVGFYGVLALGALYAAA